MCSTVIAEEAKLGEKPKAKVLPCSRHHQLPKSLISTHNKPPLLPGDDCDDLTRGPAGGPRLFKRAPLEQQEAGGCE
ncbi:unnamed protein product [Vitrella brassicaformis CCMP3155]|uniref:Uncharacterized protein n=1 Tax=Vitrella brassicaformis (strain CCMP3155) TaxID=1169540 RepID=A0A0G4FGF4_VITBC|nr:unnamed protein product [Vitrella brassicaformis CCMP3155]|eukprot:CEM12344.1 unnamed protein product [Vitrella brassicaformis CCMP3155]